jgi:predicted ATPase/DNA-binding winged helix-turn-helix (wHTH) protein
MKQFESFRLDTSNECLWHSGAQIALPPKPFAILRYLVENPGRLITHDELLDALWPETYVQPQVLRTYMLELRKVLGDDAGAPRFIQTIPKRGYSFVAPVVEGGEAKNGAPAASPASYQAWHQTSNTEAHSAFIDREEEMRRLQSVLQLVAGGQRQAIFVTGGTGIGKTALVDAFLRHAASTVIIARGQCVEALGRKEEYYPLMEALAYLCVSPDGDRACRILARIAPGWLPTLGVESQAGSEFASPVRTGRVPGELCAALEELATEKALILVFEDLHWADDSTLGVISALARRRTPARLMVLGTYRAQDGSADQALKALKQDLIIRRLCVELNLAPLGRSAVRQLLNRELGQESLPPGLDDFIYARSEGNPLFVKAMLENLIAERYLVREETVREETGGSGSWRQRAPFPEYESGVPDELSQMIELEIERLGAEDQRLLEAASLTSVAFPAWAVAAALEEDAAEIEEACDDLARRLYFVRRAGQDELPDGTRSAFYVFAHGLYREVLYQRQSTSRRARRHTRIAERLAQLFAGREVNVAQEMAMHYEAAGNWRRAAGVLCSAARSAHERLACLEAEALLDRALRLAENLASPQRHALEAEIHAERARVRKSVPPAVKSV